MKRQFEDNERMETFDVSFANLYITAYRAYQAGLPCPKVWELSFDYSQNGGITILQHIILGMNAHINLDLGLAAGRLMRGKALHKLGPDFRKVNDILESLIDEMQARTASVSPILRLMDYFGRQRDEEILDFSMRAAREQAWVVAQKVWETTQDEEAAVIKRVDDNVYRLGQRFARPRSRLSRWVLRLTAWLETKETSKIIQRLSSDF